MKPAFGNGGLETSRRNRLEKVIKIMSANNYGILVLCQGLCRWQGKEILLREADRDHQEEALKLMIERLGKGVDIDFKNICWQSE